MSIKVNGDYITRVSVGAECMIAVWEGSNLKFPNGLLRSNGPVSESRNRDNLVQHALAAPFAAQAGSTAQIYSGVLPALYDGLRGFYCNVSGSYLFRYKTTLLCNQYPGATIELRIALLIYNSGTGNYDNTTVIASYTPPTFIGGETRTIDWGDGFSVYLESGNYYCFAMDGSALAFTESNASASLIYRG